MEGPGTIQISSPDTIVQLDHVRDLVREFVHWQRDRHKEDFALINDYFDAEAFEEELSTLPGKYGKPGGCLLLAWYDGLPAGCVALRRIDDQSCEMKRMFVYTRFHRKGIGRALATAIIKEARTIGYHSMKLNTGIRQAEALKLYEEMGFHKTPPYYELSDRHKNWLVFMESDI